MAIVSVALIWSAPTAIGVVTAEVTVMVAAVPFCVATRVALPPPHVPQSYVAVAEPGETAAAVGAKASEAAASPPARTATAPKVLLLLMASSNPFRWRTQGCGHCVNGGDLTVRRANRCSLRRRPHGKAREGAVILHKDTNVVTHEGPARARRALDVQFSPLGHSPCDATPLGHSPVRRHAARLGRR